MKPFIQKNHRLLFYFSLLLLGIIQARFTELQDDEAYYWVYSKFPDWGYFDHPPMIAILVKMGYALFPNELGVRLFPLLLTILSLVIIEDLTGKKNSPLFYTLILSLGILQLGGFMAAPDIPLIFFTALFFRCYKSFITTFSLSHTFLLGLSVALLLYSKYHAILIVFFVLLSDIKLLTRYQVYLVLLIALLLFSPHLWWQYQHDWISIRYHLFENKVNDYKISFTLSYFLGQLLIQGPFAGFILLPAAFLYKPKNQVERALYFTMAGFYAFFLFSSFRGKVEANWTSPVLVPVILLSFQFLQVKNKWQLVLRRLLPLTLVIVLFARAVMLFDILPVKKIVFRFHSWKTWPQEMKKITRGLPVVFNNSYQRASKYWFYTGQRTYSLNYYHWRMNNYNYWPVEDSILGKPAFYLDIRSPFQFRDSLKYPLGYIVYKYDSCFASYAKIKVRVLPEKPVVVQGDSLTLRCWFDIPPLYGAFIKNHPPVNDTIRIGVFTGKKWIKDIFTGLSLRQINERPQAELRFNPGITKGKYEMRFAINTGIYTPTHNSDKIELVIK